MSNTAIPPLSSFLNRESDEVTETIVGIPVYIGKIKIPTPPPPRYLCLELYFDNEDDGVWISEVQLYENSILVQEAKLCMSCLTETTDRDGCMCSLPKGYCHECGDTKCNRLHADDMAKGRKRKARKN